MESPLLENADEVEGQVPVLTFPTTNTATLGLDSAIQVLELTAQEIVGRIQHLHSPTSTSSTPVHPHGPGQNFHNQELDKSSPFLSTPKRGSRSGESLARVKVKGGISSETSLDSNKSGPPAQDSLLINDGGTSDKAQLSPDSTQVNERLNLSLLVLPSQQAHKLLALLQV